MPAVFREEPSDSLRKPPRASGLEAWGAFEDAFEDDALEVFRDISDPTSGPPPRGCLGACIAAAACLANPPGTHPALTALVAPALLELMRSCTAVSLAGVAALMLGEGVDDGVFTKNQTLGRATAGFDPSTSSTPGGGFFEELLREACDTAEALAGPSGIEPGARARGIEKAPPSPSQSQSPRTKARGWGQSPRASADWTDRRSPRSPGSPPPGSNRSGQSGASREPVGTPVGTPVGAPSASRRRSPDGSRLVGTPAEKAATLQAVDSLLFALARSNPESFATFLSRRIQTAAVAGSKSSSHVHVVALSTLARVAKESHPRVLTPRVVKCLIGAVLAALNPANVTTRRDCLAAGLTVVAELARALPHASYHRATGRLAIGVAPAPEGGASAVVYDLTVAAAWRTLVDRDDHPAEEARRLIDGFGAGFGAWATGLAGTHKGASTDSSDKARSEFSPSTDSIASTWTDGWTNTLASYAGHGTADGAYAAKSPKGQRTSGDGVWTLFGGGGGRRRSSGGGRWSGDGTAGGSFAGDSPTSPEARTARAHAAMAAIPVPETPEQRYAAAAAAAAAAMTASAGPPRKSFESPVARRESAAVNNADDNTYDHDDDDDDSAQIEVMAWDEKGERLAAYLDRRSVVRVWNVAHASWRPTNLFSRATYNGGDASEVGYSHSVRCVVPETNGTREDDDARVDKQRTSLAWRDDKTVTLRRGGFDASFGVGD